MIRVRWPAVRLRLAVLVLAALVTAAVPHPGVGLLLFVILGTACAVLAPGYLGAAVLVVAEIVGWAVAYGADATPSPLRTVGFAVALYLLHAATALAASVPIESDVGAGIVSSWAWRCVPGVASAVLAGALVGLVGRLHGSVVLDVVGMAAVVGVVALLVRASRSLDRREST